MDYFGKQMICIYFAVILMLLCLACRGPIGQAAMEAMSELSQETIAEEGTPEPAEAGGEVPESASSAGATAAEQAE